MKIWKIICLEFQRTAVIS